ncbi:YjhX family toxin [Mesorhizobium sp. KR1-2]|uniref:YjhX family toxin n=1 Tax=Mesorhizobium sp. KR1-2 TaxID=3156609 RepID=UPI0032B48671
MNISRNEQRILHLLAQGGRIELEKDENKRIEQIWCLTREGWAYTDFDLKMFRKLKRKRAIASSNGGPYRITRHGLQLVRAEQNNR